MNYCQVLGSLSFRGLWDLWVLWINNVWNNPKSHNFVYAFSVSYHWWNTIKISMPNLIPRIISVRTVRDQYSHYPCFILLGSYLWQFHRCLNIVTDTDQRKLPDNGWDWGTLRYNGMTGHGQSDTNAPSGSLKVSVCQTFWLLSSPISSPKYQIQSKFFFLIPNSKLVAETIIPGDTDLITTLSLNYLHI